MRGDVGKRRLLYEVYLVDVSPMAGTTEKTTVMMVWPVQKQVGTFLALTSTRYAKTLVVLVKVYSRCKKPGFDAAVAE